MRKDHDSWIDMAPDAIIGYSTLVLAIACFLLALVVIVAIVRFVVGVGAA